MSTNDDADDQDWDAGGGMPEEEVSAIEFSHSQGLVLMENDTWMTEEDALAAVGADEVEQLRARIGDFLERVRGHLDIKEA